MQKLTNQFISKVQQYLEPEPEFNLFAIGDLERFGMEDPNVSCYTADDWCIGMELPYFILDYRGNFLIYSHCADYDAEQVGRFLDEKKPRNISGKDEIVRKLLPYLNNKTAKLTYLARLNEVTEQQKKQSGALMENVRKLTQNDIPEIYSLYLLIDEFSYTYRNKPKEECFEDIRVNLTGLGRSYGIFENQQLISIAQTSAENRASAMVIGVATHPDYRKKGYAKATVLKLCSDCLAEGKQFLCLFYDNPEAGTIYHSIGFKDMGMYTMLQNQEGENKRQ
ncbi:MAG: GNAT family N-acetyltransferase [Lachnospiraceae bacterium]|nr:GNAT family N-acetyltransferase [Lachnospiraceae bacterium]